MTVERLKLLGINVLVQQANNEEKIRSANIETWLCVSLQHMVHLLVCLKALLNSLPQ